MIAEAGTISAGRLARDLQFDSAIAPRLQRAVSVGHIDLGQQGVRVPGCSASAIRATVPWKVRLGIAGTRMTASTPGLTPKAASCGT